MSFYPLQQNKETQDIYRLLPHFAAPTTHTLNFIRDVLSHDTVRYTGEINIFVEI